MFKVFLVGCSDFQCGCWGLEVMNWTLPQTKTQPQEIAKDLLNADMFPINLGLSMWANLRGEFLCHWGICPSHFLEALNLQRVGATPPPFSRRVWFGSMCPETPRTSYQILLLLIEYFWACVCCERIRMTLNFFQHRFFQPTAILFLDIAGNMLG